MRVSEEHFGAIYSGFPQDFHFTAVLSEIGASITRWPGGTLSELRQEVYDISNAIIFDPTFLFSENANRSRMSISEVIEYANSYETLNVVVPTFRYLDSVPQGLSDIDALLGNLANDEALDGKTIRLGIGNEYYGIEGFEAEQYGSVANAFLNHILAIDEMHFDFNLEVSIQTGKGVLDNSVIIDALDADALSRIDAVNVHALPINHENLYSGSGPSQDRFAEMSNMFSHWTDTFDQHGLAAPERHLTAWGVGSSANSVSDVELEYQDFGARGGVTTLALFGEMIQQDITEASVWGVGVQNLNSLGTLSDDGIVSLSHSGTVFKELNNSIVGMEYLDSFRDISWNSGVFEFGYQAYAAPGRLVLYAASGEDSVSAVVNVSTKVSGIDLQSVRLVEAKELNTTYLPGFTPTGSSHDRLFELPEIVDVSTSEGLVGIASGFVQFTNHEQFRITEATYSWRHTGTPDDDIINGLIYSDRFDGGLGNDTIGGYDGDDELVGGIGNDLLIGGTGDDLLFGDNELPEYFFDIA